MDPANETYSSTDGVLFDKDRTTLIRCPPGKKGSYAVPAGVTHIEGYAFSDCTGLTEVTIADSVTSIGECAFCNCAGLLSLTIPDSVTRIERLAFANCTGLIRATIGNSVVSLGNRIFDACSELRVVCFQGNPRNRNTARSAVPMG